MQNWDTEFFVIFCHFLPFGCANDPENQNFEKLKKKMPGENILLHKCTINKDDMMYDS